MSDLPVHARKLVDEAKAAGHEVNVTREDWGGITVTVATGFPNTTEVFSASWWPVRGAWRYRHGTDGWHMHMTLREIRSLL